MEDIKQCIPKLSSDAKFAFDPYFYILFWALELPDLAEDTEQKYSELNKELLAKLDSEKRGLKEMTVADQRNRSKSGSRYEGLAQSSGYDRPEGAPMVHLVHSSSECLGLYTVNILFSPC